MTAARPPAAGSPPAGRPAAAARLAGLLLVAVLLAAALPSAPARAQAPAAPPADTLSSAAIDSAAAAVPAPAVPLVVEAPGVVLGGIPFDVTARGETPLDSADLAGLAVVVNGQPVPVAIETVEAGAVLAARGVRAATGAVRIEVVRGPPTAGAVAGAAVASAASQALPGWVSLLPPLLAIVVALLFRRVIPALFLGVLFGAWAVEGFTPGGLWRGLLDTFQVYVLDALADRDHAAIVLFSLMIGGMVGIISKNGGTRGVVNRIAGWANTPKRGQLATWLLGLVIFFDDYANSLIIGNTMRPVTDRLRVSREKLAFIVDATSAPVASLALVTTWIGFEVGLINEALATIPDLNLSGYSVFLESILYRFYPILMLFFVLMIALTDREFGPMARAEQRARTTGKVLGDDARVDEAAADGKELEPKPGRPQRAVNAIGPVLVLVAGVLGGLWATGEGETLRDIVGSADSYKALMWASLLGVLAAAALSIGQRILTLDETVEAWYAGLKSMLFAMIILVLAWALSAITGVLFTGPYLGSALSSAIPPGAVPFLIFILAAVTSFATGSSWGTMGILMPLVVPVTWQVMGAHGVADAAHMHILYSAVSCVLAGSVWGDHCSPISDTTILSSMASGCDHIEHVRTQLPYALAVGGAALLLGTLPTGFGVPWWVCMPVGAVALAVALRVLGTRIVEPDEGAATDEAVAVTEG